MCDPHALAVGYTRPRVRPTAERVTSRQVAVLPTRHDSQQLFHRQNKQNKQHKGRGCGGLLTRGVDTRSTGPVCNFLENCVPDQAGRGSRGNTDSVRGYTVAQKRTEQSHNSRYTTVRMIG